MRSDGDITGRSEPNITRKSKNQNCPLRVQRPLKEWVFTKDHYFSRDLQSTIPRDGLILMVGLTSRVPCCGEDGWHGFFGRLCAAILFGVHPLCVQTVARFASPSPSPGGRWEFVEVERFWRPKKTTFVEVGCSCLIP